MMEEGEDVVEPINKLRTLAGQLDDVRAPVNESDLVIPLFRSLRDSLQLLITVLESRADTLTGSW